MPASGRPAFSLTARLRAASLLARFLDSRAFELLVYALFLVPWLGCVLLARHLAQRFMVGGPHVLVPFWLYMLGGAVLYLPWVGVLWAMGCGIQRLRSWLSSA